MNAPDKTLNRQPTDNQRAFGILSVMNVPALPKLPPVTFPDGTSVPALGLGTW